MTRLSCWAAADWRRDANKTLISHTDNIILRGEYYIYSVVMSTISVVLSVLNFNLKESSIPRVSILKVKIEEL